jgi:hypothetical protein
MAAVEEGATPEVESSVRDDILASIKEVEARETEETPEPIKESKPRDESGRFAPKTETESPPEPAREEPQAPEIPAAVPQTQTAFTAAPGSWSNAAKGKWAALDPDLRAEITKREADVHRGFTKMDEERAFAKEMQRVVAPYEALMRAAGAKPADVIQNTLNTVYVLRTADAATKAAAIARVCEQYGVDLSLVSQPQQIDPALSATQNRLAQLEQQLQQQTFERQQAAENEVLSQIQAFGQDAKHPHFNAVQIEMGALMQAGRAENMEQAYEMAVWTRPDLRAEFQAAEAAQLKAQTAQKAQKARAKGSSVRGGPGGYQAAPSKPNATVREDLESAFEEARGRI